LPGRTAITAESTALICRANPLLLSLFYSVCESVFTQNFPACPVFDDKIIFTYNYKDGTDTISLAYIEAALGSDFSDGCPPPNRNRFDTKSNSSRGCNKTALNKAKELVHLKRRASFLV